MSNLSSSHQVSISHDPLETARPDMRSARSTAREPFVEASDLRPALLVGAIGLFAAWLVSGVNARRTGRRPQGARRVAQDAPRSLAPRSSFAPERGSPEDFALDAMNP